jgi:hypothetical protein
MRRSLIAVALVLWSTGFAAAADLSTPSLAAVGSQFMECRVVNASPVARTVRIRAYDSTGAKVSDFTEKVAPRGMTGFSIPASAAAVHCRFSAAGVPNKHLRGSIDVLDGSGAGIVVALPAR